MNGFIVLEKGNGMGAEDCMGTVAKHCSVIWRNIGGEKLPLTVVQKRLLIELKG